MRNERNHSAGSMTIHIPRKSRDEAPAPRPPERDDGKKDKIHILVQKVGSEKFEPFFVGLAQIRLNGSSAHVFGRSSEDGSDRQIEVVKLVFRRQGDLEMFAAFDARLAESQIYRRRHKSLPPDKACELGVDYVSERKKETLERYLSHPAVMVNEKLFVNKRV